MRQDGVNQLVCAVAKRCGCRLPVEFSITAVNTQIYLDCDWKSGLVLFITVLILFDVSLSNVVPKQNTYTLLRVYEMGTNSRAPSLTIGDDETFFRETLGHESGGTIVSGEKPYSEMFHCR